MESTDLDMDEIFDDNDIDEDIGATGVLPDLPEATQTQNDDEENAEVLARLKDLSKGAAKKVVRKPQPKLDPTRLSGDRGIPILPKVFKDVKFKGKGHEAQDLATLMREMEHWAHRLFPKMPFDEVIERVEKLGSKNEVKTCIKKIRLDMPILDNDFVGSDKEDDDVLRVGEEEAGKGEVRADDMWDELLREEAEVTASQMQPDVSAEPGTSNVQPPSPPAGDTEPVFGTPTARLQKETDTAGGFTPEQLERIEKNKQLAMERRLKKIGHLTPGSKAMPSQTAASDETVGSQNSEETSHAIDEGDTDTMEGISQTVKSADQGNSQTMESNRETLKSPNEGNSQTSESVAEGCREEGESDMLAIDNDNSGKFEEMDTEMSEVLEKGPSQNITVAQIPSDNAQNWHTGPAAGTETGLTFGSESTKGTETMDVGSSTVADNGIPSEEMSEVIENQDVGKNHSVKNSNTIDSQEMSEIIEKQDDVKVILKEKPGDLNNDCTGNKQTSDIKISKSPSARLNTGSSNHDKENIEKNKKENIGKETEVLVKEKLNKTNDNVSSEANAEDFDDELTEDQLMDSLES